MASITSKENRNDRRQKWGCYKMVLKVILKKSAQWSRANSLVQIQRCCGIPIAQSIGRTEIFNETLELSRKQKSRPIPSSVASQANSRCRVEAVCLQCVRWMSSSQEGYEEVTGLRFLQCVRPEPPPFPRKESEMALECLPVLCVCS